MIENRAIDRPIVANPEVNSQRAVQGTNPGEPRTASTVKDTLMAELTRAGQVADTTGKQLGMAPMERRKFAERGIRIGGKVVAQAELDENLSLQKRAIKDYIAQAGFTDMNDTAIAESYMNERFNAIRMNLLKIAAKYNQKLTKEKLDRQKKSAFFKNLGGIAGTIVGGIVGGIYGNAPGAAAGAAIGGAAGTGAGTLADSASS